MVRMPRPMASARMAWVGARERISLRDLVGEVEQLEDAAAIDIADVVAGLGGDRVER